ncbi:hypothetical protein ABIC10_001044 [Bradyrhizobium sp. S3.2.12]
MSEVAFFAAQSGMEVGGHTGGRDPPTANLQIVCSRRNGAAVGIHVGTVFGTHPPIATSSMPGCNDWASVRKLVGLRAGSQLAEQSQGEFRPWRLSAPPRYTHRQLKEPDCMPASFAAQRSALRAGRMSEAAILWPGSPRELSKQKQWNGFSGPAGRSPLVRAVIPLVAPKQWSDGRGRRTKPAGLQTFV